jgi:SAM-dependent methyltransferase
MPPAETSPTRRLVNVHPVEETMAMSFGDQALTYDRLRPGYPDQAVTFALDGVPGPRLLDLGAGTGALTRRLLDAGLGYDVVAVEPDARMRAVLADTTEGAAVLDGNAERVPLPDAAVDAVLVAQAFHWFTRPAADREIARVLRPGGLLAILTNTNPAGADREAVLHQRVLGVEQAPLTRDRAPLASELFAEATTQVFDNPHLLDLDDFLQLTTTWSWVATASDDQRAEVRRQAEALFAECADPAQHVLSLPYQLEVVRAVRR